MMNLYDECSINLYECIESSSSVFGSQSLLTRRRCRCSSVVMTPRGPQSHSVLSATEQATPHALQCYHSSLPHPSVG